jgi:hypothetical protein
MRTPSIGQTTPASPTFRRALPLAALDPYLSDAEIDTICRQFGRPFRHRVFSPGVTVRAMTYRGLSPDRSIRAVLAELDSTRDPDASPLTDAAYCQARDRLPEAVWTVLRNRSVARLNHLTGDRFLFHGRPVYAVDGSSVSMPDTPDLAQTFGYAKTRHGRSRFPVARFTVLLLHGVEALLDYRLGPYTDCEDAHFQAMWHHLPKGAICLADRRFGSFYNLAKLLARGVDYLGRLYQRRDPDRLIAAGRKIGRGQWLVSFTLAPQLRKRYHDPTLPETLTIRLIRVRFRPAKGKKRHTVWLITTLLDPLAYPRGELVRLYRKRWGIETRFGSLKTTLQLNVLRSQTAAHVRTEVAATVLAHNLVWTVIHQAVRRRGIPADRISFIGAARTLLLFSPILRFTQGAERVRIYEHMLARIRADTNPLRPNRIEPRLIKREPVRYAYLRTSRAQAREKCLS